MNILDLAKKTDKNLKANKGFNQRLLIATIFTIIVFLSELFFRKPLFDLSESAELYFQKNFDPIPYKIISDVGTIPTFFPIMIIFFIIFPLNIPFALFSVIIHASYWDNILKILYGEARPYWVFRDLVPSCNGGFGNPSGHSMSSSAVYLSIWHILSNLEFFENSYLWKILMFIMFNFIILLVIFSRLVLAAHTINQVLFGCLLGISVYLFHFYVFQMDKLKSRDFFELFRSKRNRALFIILYSALFLISIIFYFGISNSKVIEDNSDYIKKNCERIDDYRKFNEDGLFNSLAIFGMIGAHIGLTLFTLYLEREKLFDRYEEIYNLNRTNSKNKAIIILALLVCGSPIIFFFILPGRMNLILVYIFKIIVPYLLGTIGLFGLSLWFIINQRCCNENIYVNIERGELTQDYKYEI
jgi:membrane-associated phospholipid phosphatase